MQVFSGDLAASGTQLEVLRPKSKSSRLPAGKPFAIKVNFPATGEARVYAVNAVE